ncbi:unnamed protein product [Ambrosiozyma monospora]|uniref:Unnamed protein product n=1 Tax=Ambrosiozyma monospora TaxID=43982 RepID=A0ACB5THM1_AMBMO|nr:unnamed protein product [Ambrosiozyma monospora]
MSTAASPQETYFISPIGKGSKFQLLDDSTNVTPDPGLQFKIVIVGDSGCGKTSLFTSFIRGYFPTEYEPTIFENSRTFLKNKTTGEVITADLWDTAGQEDYERLRRLSYQDSNLIILAYSLNARESLLNIPEVWAPEILSYCENTPILLVGLKADIPEHNVDPFDAVKVANSINAVAHIQCSAKEMFNVSTVFDTCFSVVYNNYKKQQRASKRFSKPTSGHFRTPSKPKVTRSESQIRKPNP